jgi:hypothetical protein
VKSTLYEIKKLLRLRMNGAVSASMRKSGLDYKLNYGLDATNIREIASRYQPDADLADTLWKESSRECKILGTLLHPKEDFSTLKADLWLQGCTVFELTEQYCFNLLQHVNFAPDKAREWTQNESPSVREAGYILALRLLLKRVELPGLQQLIITAKTDVQANQYRLQLTASRFLERAEWDSENQRKDT